MIYCNLKGGLGNMMFQIAATLCIASENNRSYFFPNLKEQLEYLNNDQNYNPKLNYANDYLNIFKKIKTSPIIGDVKRIEYPFHYEKKNIDDESILIDGFFQSEKYFKTCKNLILNNFDFKNVCDDYVSKNYNFKNFKTTSIHVRRGDYLKYPNHHPVQSVEYYKKASELLKKETDVFLVFSDDIDWCKENLNFLDPIYIKNEKDYIELYLMSLCNNNIICNSSFSWWGAWLNKNKNKKVIGPKLWFGDSIKEKTDDIIPENWIKI